MLKNDIRDVGNTTDLVLVFLVHLVHWYLVHWYPLVPTGIHWYHGWVGLDWDLCAGLWYEHRFAVLIMPILTQASALILKHR